MITITAILTGASSALLLLLAAIHFASRKRNAQKTLFILWALCIFPAMAALTFAIVSDSVTPM